MKPLHRAQGRLPHEPEPFSNAEQAWFWTMGALRARREGISSSGASTPRPCDPDDIIRCLDQLYRTRHIAAAHARILRIWGERQMPPRSNHPAEHTDSTLWQEAMTHLTPPLRHKRIIA